jgi:hypothetical protein
MISPSFRESKSTACRSFSNRRSGVNATSRVGYFWLLVETNDGLKAHTRVDKVQRCRKFMNTSVVTHGRECAIAAHIKGLINYRVTRYFAVYVRIIESRLTRGQTNYQCLFLLVVIAVTTSSRIDVHR